MTEQGQIYNCSICGNVVEVLHPGKGQLVCCNQPMELLKAKTEDLGQEKHVPTVESTDTGIKVKVGSVPHPMEENHYIEWIELTADTESYKKFLKPFDATQGRPGDKPEAKFDMKTEEVTARIYCNVHGLWKSS